MREALFGIETEYAICGVTAHGRVIPPQALAVEVLRIAESELPHLRGRRRSDLFLQNGSRLYVDCGAHPELATPECLDPWDVVRYVRAGDRLLDRLARQAWQLYGDGGSVSVLRSNVGYGAERTTWGCHESYLFRSAPGALFDVQLVPHLVSRIVYTGAGGFNPTLPGLAFTLSPRSAYIGVVRSRESTSQRGILHGRDEPLASGSERLHILFGDTLCSNLALWLKVGTTALLVAMADAGVRPGDAVQPASPIDALRMWAADQTGRVEVPLARGGSASAIAVQRHLLQQAIRHRRASFMPPWTDEVCARWGQVLDRLERGPEDVARSLDWAIKRALFVGHAERRGFPWASLPDWNRKLVAAGTRAPEGRLLEYARLTRQLFEIDLRFGDVGEAGLFATLERGGAIAHDVGVSEAAFTSALDTPPDAGRAQVRGRAIARLTTDRDKYWCYWTGIWNDGIGQRMDLDDPFEAAERWVSASYVEAL